MTNNAPLREGKGYLYEGGIRVPLIIKWPGHIEAESLCHAPVTSDDLYPTIVQMAGEGCVPNDIIDGVSLVPLLAGHGQWQERDLHWYYPHYSPQAKMPGAVIRSGDWKLIRHYDPEKIELFNLANDLSEQNDLSEKMPQKTSELKAKLENWLESVDAQMHTLNPDYEN